MNKILFISMIFFCFSCKKAGKADYHLSIDRSKLVDILVDIHMAETMIKQHPSLQKDSLKKLYYTEIYTIHQIDTQELKKNLAELGNDVKLNEEVRKQVIDTLRKIQTYKYRPEIR